MTDHRELAAGAAAEGALRQALGSVASFAPLVCDTPGLAERLAGHASADGASLAELAEAVLAATWQCSSQTTAGMLRRRQVNLELRLRRLAALGPAKRHPPDALT